MRVRIYETPSNYKEFFTMKEAVKHYGKTMNYLKKHYKVERVYNEGYWDCVDKDYLKAISVARYGTPRCLITDA